MGEELVVLQVRGFPKELQARVKVAAAAEGKTIGEWLIQAVKGELEFLAFSDGRASVVNSTEGTARDVGTVRPKTMPVKKESQGKNVAERPAHHPACKCPVCKPGKGA